MKITGFTPIKNTSSAKARKDSSAGSTSFLDFLDGSSEADAAAEAAPVENAAPVSILDAMLSLQEVPEDELRRKKEIQRGKSMLDTLEQLRHNLLTGRIPQHMLGTISQQLKTARETLYDPRLKEIIDEIELRAAVELAKLEMSQNKSA